MNNYVSRSTPTGRGKHAWQAFEATSDAYSIAECLSGRPYGLAGRCAADVPTCTSRAGRCAICTALISQQVTLILPHYIIGCISLFIRKTVQFVGGGLLIICGYIMVCLYADYTFYCVYLPSNFYERPHDSSMILGCSLHRNLFMRTPSNFNRMTSRKAAPLSSLSAQVCEYFRHAPDGSTT